MAEEEGEFVKVTFLFTPNNYDRLWTAAALQGESRTDALNRAVAFYDEVHRLEPPTVTGRIFKRRRLAAMSWVDGDGQRRRIARME
jgi:hypothetical protein